MMMGVVVVVWIIREVAGTQAGELGGHFRVALPACQCGGCVSGVVANAGAAVVLQEESGG